MTDLVRIFAVESAEPGFGASPKRHAVLAARAGEGVDVVHLWTGDAALAAALGPGATVELRVVSDRRTHVIRRGGEGAHEWLATAPIAGAAILWTPDEDEAVQCIGHHVALEDARICAAAGHTVAVLPLG